MVLGVQVFSFQNLSQLNVTDDACVSTQLLNANTHQYASCANLSIGVMMKGIVERPIAVVVHLRMGRGHFVVLPSRYSDAAHTRLMVKPGMMTEAKACHTNVSTTATATRVVFPGLSP